ncbi:MAG: homoserine O-succinyltransferase, partial [Clostridia bacterium]|nr:homoserine O-succinyltransferase [Clostridia bacterium]
YICWASQAGLYYHYGINKHELDKKLSGVYKHKVLDEYCPLLRGFDDEYFAPHSRYTGISREDVEKCEKLDLVTFSEAAGCHIIVSKNGKRIFVSGHSEYDPDTLKREYERDVAKGINPEIPFNYFEDDDPSKQPIVTWRAHANLLFSNWINYYVYQATPYDIDSAALENQNG